MTSTYSLRLQPSIQFVHLLHRCCCCCCYKVYGGKWVCYKMVLHPSTCIIYKMQYHIWIAMCTIFVHLPKCFNAIIRCSSNNRSGFSCHVLAMCWQTCYFHVEKRTCFNWTIRVFHLQIQSYRLTQQINGMNIDIDYYKRFAFGLGIFLYFSHFTRCARQSFFFWFHPCSSCNYWIAAIHLILFIPYQIHSKQLYSHIIRPCYIIFIAIAMAAHTLYDSILSSILLMQLV